LKEVAKHDMFCVGGDDNVFFRKKKKRLGTSVLFSFASVIVIQNHDSRIHDETARINV
jgi:hypothetical protein